MISPIIRHASPADLEMVGNLLVAASLPIEGVKEHFANFLVAEADSATVGTIGLEVYGATALLRSAVVSEDYRNGGIGSRLYERLLAHAQELKIRRLILLTNTAEVFFGRKGFRKIDQKGVTGPITRSVEFTGACPSHAVCMELIL